ncbi:MAG: TRC40/GET3/ArsA family transport-energizing ATPase [Candidatus Korarchaeum sp.]|nr:TRC40/GET3/ArsA family transport-energizing ATPase [Candidatus Korarchaeum sp.]MDW8036270.1 TRC40/GET3/ArsA family transport-energizing ATPase [Candidatus Korarchaeum sp.]
MKLVSFWGKGGVGKTTCSAALAAGLSEIQGMRVLLLTTDLTPTLSDVLMVGLESSPTKVEGCSNLFALELDEETIIRRWKQRFGSEVYEVVSSFLPVDESFIDYVAGAPGIAEQFVLYSLYEIVKGKDYDVVVWDTPASSSSLRLLRIEKELYEHMGEALKMYLRLKGFLDKIRSKGEDPLRLIGEWRELAKRIFDMLSSDYHSAYIVATPERISYEVSKRMRGELLSFGIDVKGVIVNKYMLNSCDALPGLRRNQEEVLELFLKDFHSVKLIEYYDREIRGRDLLLSFYRALSIQLP